MLGKAQKWVAARAPQVARPAIVLYIDETSLFNWPRIYQQGYAFFSTFPGVDDCSFVRGRRSLRRSRLAEGWLRHERDHL